MTDQRNATSIQSWIAIDIAKEFNAVMVESNDGMKRRFRMANSASDHDRLISFLRTLPQPCKVGFEATGNYHRPLGYRLLREGFDVCLISSVAGARFREALFNSWDKNDPKDAEVLLSMLKQNMTQRYVDPLLAGNHDMQELSKTYYDVTLARTRLQHSLLTHYLPLYFPEMGKWWHSTRADWLIDYLLHYPTPASVTSCSYEVFHDAAWPVIGRKVNKSDRLRELYETAQHSIALPVTQDSLAMETYRLQLLRFKELNRQRKQLEERAKLALSINPDYVLLQTIPGVGPINALTILAEGGDLRRFAHHRQFLKYCGFDLAKNQSGTKRGQEHVSKRGNARLRQALWMAGQVAVRQRENSFRYKYERYIQTDPGSGDLKRKALTAVAAKMARVVYGLIKFQRPYQGYFEQALPSGSIPFSRAVEAIRTS